MYFTTEQIQQTCGILICNDFNRFVYYCTKCRCEFNSGKELEEHIVFDHHDKKKHVDGIFIDDGVILEKTTTLSALPFVSLVKTEVIPCAIAVPTDQVVVDSTSEATENISGESEQQQQSPSPPLEIDYHSTQKVPHEIQNDAIPIEDPIGGHDAVMKNCDESTNETLDVPDKSKQNQAKRQKGSFYCDMCPDRSFRSLTAVKAHIKKHVNDELLKQCSLCPLRPKNMENHMRYAHTEAKPYKCVFCGASFKKNAERVIHSRTHTGERPYLCAKCGKSFKSEDSCQKHNTRVHSEQLPHPCTKCDRRFISPSELQEHIYSFHSTERPYTCEICGHSYSTRRYLRRHHQSHGERIHLCNYCGKTFKTIETRRWHLRNVHKIL